jgi:hypothetical protein
MPLDPLTVLHHSRPSAGTWRVAQRLFLVGASIALTTVLGSLAFVGGAILQQRRAAHKAVEAIDPTQWPKDTYTALD